MSSREFYFLVLLMIGSPKVKADINDNLYVKWMLSVKNGVELNESKARHARYIKFKTACEIELIHELIPFHCFIVLNEERDAQLLSVEIFEGQREFLMRRCLNANFHKHGLKDLKKKVQSDLLPNPCRQAVLKAQNIRLYQAQESHPENIFKSRF